MKRTLIQCILMKFLPQAHRQENVRNWLSSELTFKTIRKICEKNNISIETVYDIGASDGSWSRNAAKQFSRANFILFEANPNYAKELEKTGFQSFQCILAKETAQRLFYSANGHGDSLYRDNSPKYQAITPNAVQAYALDDVVRDNILPIPNLIKIDTQGSEVEILTGGAKLLNGVNFLYLECPLFNCNEGAPSIIKYLELASEHGFKPVQIGEIHRTRNQYLVQIDILFAKTELIPSTPY